MRRAFAIALAVLALSASALAQQVVVTMPPAMSEAKILFCYCGTPSVTNLTPGGGFTEDSILQPWQDWYHSRPDNTTTARQMIADGWTLQSIIPRGASVVDQFYVTFVKYAPPVIVDPPAPERVRSTR